MKTNELNMLNGVEALPSEKTLHEVLLENPSPAGTPLFESAADLARAIKDLPSGGFGKSTVKSLSTFISQVFAGKSACSESLGLGIQHAAEARLSILHSSEEAKKLCLGQLSSALDAQKFRRVVRMKNRIVASASSELFDDLLRAAEMAREHFIVTQLTAEVHLRDKHAAELRKILVGNLGLYDAAGSEQVPAREQAAVRYTFYLPYGAAAENFWTSLYRLIVLDNPLGRDKCLDTREASERLQKLDENDRLEVYEVPTYVCGCPIVVFNPEEKAVGYSFCYYEDHSVGVLRWDRKSITLWEQNFYRSRHSIPGKARCHWLRVTKTTRVVEEVSRIRKEKMGL